MVPEPVQELDVVGGEGANVAGKGAPGKGKREADFFHYADLSIVSRETFPRNGFAIERPARSPKTKTPSDSGKTENEGIQRIRRKQFSELASSFSLSEKRPRACGA